MQPEKQRGFCIMRAGAREPAANTTSPLKMCWHTWDQDCCCRQLAPRTKPPRPDWERLSTTRTLAAGLQSLPYDVCSWRDCKIVIKQRKSLPGCRMPAGTGRVDLALAFLETAFCLFYCNLHRINTHLSGDHKRR